MITIVILILLCSIDVNNCFTSQSNLLRRNIRCRDNYLTLLNDRNKNGIEEKIKPIDDQSKANNQNPKKLPQFVRLLINPMTYLPIPILLYGSHKNAESDLLTWIEPARTPQTIDAWKYFLAGAISASFSHFITVPFDVVKTRIQVDTRNNGNTTSAKKANLFQYAAQLVKDEGIGVLATGTSKLNSPSTKTN